jgi:hypothetical protein
VIEVPAGALVYEVTRREPFDPVAFAEAETGLREELLNQRRTQLHQSVVGQLRQRHEVLVNEELVNQLNG